MTSLEDILIKFAAKVQAIDDIYQGEMKTLEVLKAVLAYKNIIEERDEEVVQEAKRMSLPF